MEIIMERGIIMDTVLDTSMGITMELGIAMDTVMDTTMDVNTDLGITMDTITVNVCREWKLKTIKIISFLSVVESEILQHRIVDILAWELLHVIYHWSIIHHATK